MGSIEEWIDFFTKAGITKANHAREYASKFVDGRIRNPVLKDLNHEILKELGVSVVGDRLTILQYIQQIEKDNTPAAVEGPGSLKDFKNNNQRKNLSKRIRELERKLQKQEDKTDILKRKIRTLNRKVATLELGEVATLVLQCFNSDRRKFQRFLNEYGYNEVDVMDRFHKVINARHVEGHPFDYKPKTVRIPEQEKIVKMFKKGNFKAERFTVYVFKFLDDIDNARVFYKLNTYVPPLPKKLVLNKFFRDLYLTFLLAWSWSLFYLYHKLSDYCSFSKKNICKTIEYKNVIVGKLSV